MIYAILIILVLIVAYVWTLSPLGTNDRVGITSAISMVALTVLTSIYAWYTRTMAEEMKKQRYTGSLPLLVPIIKPIQTSFAQELPQELAQEVSCVELQGGLSSVTWRNDGKGVAINALFSFWAMPMDDSPGKALFFPPRESTALEIGGHKEIRYTGTWRGLTQDLSEKYHPRLEAEYQDIHERKITSVQEFRIEENGGRKRAFLGELYFTVNGRRLGQEVASNDP